MAAPASSLAVLVVLCATLVTPTAGQGVNVGPEQLGAGEAATATQFDAFEELLDLASQSTGGRGGKSRSSSSSFKTGASGFNVKTLEQLRESIFYIAGSPAAYNSWNTSQNHGGISLLPAVRDQRSCDTCVAHAMAAAIEAAAASAIRLDAKNISVNAQSLYYCSDGGRTCKTGWDLQEALATVMDKAQYIIRPTSCITKRARLQNAQLLNDAPSEPQVFDWKPACSQAQQACRGESSRGHPWLSCSYKSLSSFTDIQRHIRQHGAVLTRITIYSDFEQHFNVTRERGMPKATVDGATYKAYNRTADSKSRVLFGHAAVIVGYNNSELTWTLLNSWGDRTTRDGLFKIAMGVAGVAVPDQTFGISCRPAPGGPLDPHSIDWLAPWINNTALKPRRPVTYSDHADEASVNLNATCYNYSATPGDTWSSIADAFGVSLQQLVKDNLQLTGKLQQVNVTLKTGTSADDLLWVANVSNAMRLAGGIEPFFSCKIYTPGQTWFTFRTCQQSNLQPCVGSWGCKIAYSEADLSQPGLAPGKAVRVCGISKPDEPGAFDRVAFFQEPKQSQPRALKALLQVMKQDTSIVEDGKYCRSRWAKCDQDNGNITALSLTLRHPQAAVLTLGDERVLYALMNLERLQDLTAHITGGSLPPQLGALHMGRLELYNNCKGTQTAMKLPSNWLQGPWQETLTNLSVTLSEPVSFSETGCGVTGTIPDAWFESPSNIEFLDLTGNRLSGSVPAGLVNMRNLGELNLSHNQFEGSIPANLSACPHLRFLNLSFNKLSGLFPRGFHGLDVLEVNNNPGLRGCVDMGIGAYWLLSEQTSIEGRCPDMADEMWAAERNATEMFFVLSGAQATGSKAQRAWHNAVASALRQLPSTIADFMDKHPLEARDALGVGCGNLGFEIVVRLAQGELHVVEVSDGALYMVWDAHDSSVDLRVLPDMLRLLPKLEKLSIEGNGLFCSNITSVKCQLPADLPQAAPASLTELKLPAFQKLPAEWGNWSTLQTLDLDGLTGTLPNWAGMHSLRRLRLCCLTGALPKWPGMTSLVSLDLAMSHLSGPLPAAWAFNMPALGWLNLQFNWGVTGDVPVTWWERFSNAIIYLEGTDVVKTASCRPPGLAIWAPAEGWFEKPLCGQSEVDSLVAVKNRLMRGVPGLLSSWTITSGPDEASPHCRTWAGVTCNDNGQVVGLDLSSLASSSSTLAVAAPISLSDVLLDLHNLTQLQELRLRDNPVLFKGSSIPPDSWASWPQLQLLDVSGCELSGGLPGALVDLGRLSRLNISNNPDISGTLPESLVANPLTALDVSDTGLSGPLPAAYAALPLQVLRVGSSSGRPDSADRSISGPLPPELGLLDGLTELCITNTWVSGSIPAAWFDAGQAGAAAAAADVLAASKTAAAMAAAAQDAARAQLQQAADHEKATRAAVAASAAAPADGMAVRWQELLQQHEQARLQAAAAARVAAAWQRLVDWLKAGGGTGAVASAAAATAPAGNGLAMLQLEVLVVSGNAGLEGSLPFQLAASKQLKALDLSRNRLSGSLPDSYGRLNQLQRLDLSGNSLTGGIPALWVGMRSLELLDLSHNPGLGAGTSLPASLYLMTGNSYKLSCLRLADTGDWGGGGLAAIQRGFESKPGSRVRVDINGTANYC